MDHTRVAKCEWMNWKITIGELDENFPGKFIHTYMNDKIVWNKGGYRKDILLFYKIWKYC